MAEIKVEVVPLEDREANFEKLKIDLQAKAQAESNDVQLGSGEVLSTYVINRSNYLLQVADTCVWLGQQLIPLPDLPSWYYYIFPQPIGTNTKFGLVYANGTDSTDRKWVVAFDYAAQKAYAEAGPYGTVDWNVIEVKLGLSGSMTEYVDPILGGKCTAVMDGLFAYAIFDD